MAKKSNKSLFRLFSPSFMPAVAVSLMGLVFSACNTDLSLPELAAEDVFAETGDVDSLYIDLKGLNNKLVCFGSDAAIAANGESCVSGDEAAGEIVLQACAEQGVKISYIGNLASETQKSSLKMILLKHKPSIDFLD